MKKTLKLVSLLLVGCLLALTFTACAPTSLEAAKTKMTAKTRLTNPMF